MVSQSRAATSSYRKEQIERVAGCSTRKSPQGRPMTHWRNYNSWLAWMSWRRRQERGRSGPFCLDWGPDWLQKMVGWRDLFLIQIFHLVVQLPQLWQKNFSLRIIKVILILIHTWAAIRMQQWGLKKLRVGHSYGFGLFMGFIKKMGGSTRFIL